MESFLQKSSSDEAFELLVDSKIFSSDIVLKAAYNWLDRAYFFFRFDTQGNIVVQAKKKSEEKTPTETLLLEYSDELLEVLLRDKLEKENKTIRETIVQTALTNAVDPAHFVSLDTDKNASAPKQIDFDKDIDEILREIENDPELKIDQAEIDKILKEIEQETQTNLAPKIPTIDPNKIQDVKKQFQARS